jgi:4a-hydroxytetrahydrobiopterin dehydratase
MSAPSSLADRKPARGGLDDAAVARLLPEVPRWEVLRPDGRPPYLATKLTFRDFSSALAFANRIGALADELDHHPDLHVSWGKLGIDLWTHDVGGLSEADFVLAARIDRALTGA